MSITACLVLASVFSCATVSSTEPAAYITHLGSNLTNNSYISSSPSEKAMSADFMSTSPSIVTFPTRESS